MFSQMIDINRYNTDTTLKRRVLQVIYERGQVTRNELTEIIGLSITSVTKFVSSLISDGVVVESGALESTGGRKTTLLSINPEFAYILGVDIGGFAAKLAIVRMDGSIVEEWFIRAKSASVPVIPLAPAELTERIAGIFERYSKDRFLAICAGISGMVNHEQGRVIFCPNIGGWDNVLLGDLLYEKFGLPVFVDTSARCMALGEMQYGAGRGVGNQILVSLGNYDIASALIIDSKLYRGSSGFAGEIGHVMSSDRGERCTCGNYDCLELSATMFMIMAQINGKLSNYRGFSPLRQLLPDPYTVTDLTPKVIMQAIEEGDKLCYETVTTAGLNTGIALANLLNVLNPGLVVLGGSVIEFFPVIVDTIRNTIRERVLVTVQQNLDVRAAEMDWHGAVVGSAVLAMEEFYK